MKLTFLQEVRFFSLEFKELSVWTQHDGIFIPFCLEFVIGMFGASWLRVEVFPFLIGVLCPAVLQNVRG